MPKRKTKQQRAIERIMEQHAEAMTGNGLFNYGFGNIGIMKAGHKIVDIGKKLIFGRQEWSPPQKKLLEQYGGQRITHITINRTALSGAITTALNTVSSTFGERSKGTTMYHLSMYLRLESGKLVLAEKNEVVNIKLVNRMTKTGENMELSANVPLNQFLENGIKAYGSEHDYFIYSAKDRNCQNWVCENLKGNNLLTPAIKGFVLQEQTKGFITDDLRKKANIITDIGHRADILINGGKL